MPTPKPSPKLRQPANSKAADSHEAGQPAAAGAHGEPAVRVLRRFRLVFNAVKTHFQQVEKKAGVGGAQIWALSVVRANPGIGVNALAQAMDIHQTTASNLVKALVQAEMLAVEKNGADRRKVQLRLLAAGGRVLRIAPGPFAGVLPEALARLDARTLLRLDEDLSALIRELGVDDKAAGIPLAQM
jgi:DNA-binding MarR family transcriptional regulator